MRKIAILFSVLVAALFIAPGLIGFKVQGQYQEMIAGIKQSGLEVVEDKYERGWFGSQAEVKFKLARPSGAPGDPIEITMHNDIVHGPLSPNGGLALASMGTSFMIDGDALFPGEENKVIHTDIGLDGMGQSIVAIPALKLAGKPGRPEIQFSGVDGVMSFDVGLSQIDVDLKMPGLWVGGENGENLNFTEVVLNSNSQSGLFGLLMGKGRFMVKQLEFNNPKRGVAVKIDSIDFSGNTSEDQGKLAFNANYLIDAVSVNSVVYGPVRFELGFANIPAEVVARVQKGIQEIKGQGLSQEQQSMAAMSLIFEAGPELLQANPKVEIQRLFVKTPDGDIDGNLSIAANGLKWDEIGNFQTVLKKLDADAAITLPEKLFRMAAEMQAKAALLRQIEQRKKMGQEIETPSEEELDSMRKEMAQQQLDFLLQQELVKREGANISTQAKLSAGLLSVNGKTVPLP